jgi:hypothetical protein
MTKTKEVINALYQEHTEEMNAFQVLHDKYAANQKKWQKEFNAEGEKILELMHFCEKQLCGKSERSGMGAYSSKLAEKFWMEIKKKLPLIDFVGATIK